MPAGDVVRNRNFKTRGDWVAELLSECASEDGKVDVAAVRALCEENGVDLKKTYPNPGVLRRTAGNMLRARARRRHGLYVGGEWRKAPEGFRVGALTENRDGSTIEPKADTEPKKDDATIDVDGRTTAGGGKDDGDGGAKGARNRTAARILFEARTIVLFGEIDEKAARETCAQLIAMSEESRDPIRLVISSPGGHVESGDAIHDMIRFVAAPVKTIGTGWVASAGAHVYLSARKNDRYCTPNTRFLLHQPMGGVGGKATDIDIEAREILKMRDRLNRVIAEETGQPIERVARDTDRNYWMDPEEARDYGVVAHVVTSIDDVR